MMYVCMYCSEVITDTAVIVWAAGSMKLSRVRLSVRPSVYPIIWPPYAAAPGSLLCARRLGDIDRLLHDWRLAGHASSVTLSADVGSWTLYTSGLDWTRVRQEKKRKKAVFRRHKVTEKRNRLLSYIS